MFQVNSDVLYKKTSSKRESIKIIFIHIENN